MKPVDSLTALFSHNRWANLVLLEHCSKLTPEQLEATIPGAYGSIIDTLRHFIASERSYFSRISTGQPQRWPKGAPPMTTAEMMESAKASGSGLIEWAPKVKPEETVQVDWDGTPRDVPKTILLTQVINHATEHRSQVMAILTQLGIQPPNLQGWEYFDKTDK